MNENPTSGPIAARKIHHDRDASTFRHSLASSQRNTALAGRRAMRYGSRGAEEIRHRGTETPRKRLNSLCLSGSVASLSVSRSPWRNLSHGLLGEGKKHLLQIRGRRSGPATGRLRGQLVERPLAARAAAAQQNEAIAHACGVGDLMNGEEQRPSLRRVPSKRLRHLSALAQIEAVERLVGEQHWLRRHQADGEQRALTLAFRQRADRRLEKRSEIE